jgi:hypothetical protein
MKSLRERSLLAAALGLFVAVLWTQPIYAAPVASDHEIEAAGSLSHAQGSDVGALTGEVSYGYYLSPGWQIGFRQAVAYTFVDDGPDSWQATSTPFVNYHFRFGENILPFLGIFGGAVWNDKDITGTIGPQAGIKFFLADQTYLGLRYRYEWFFNTFRSAANNKDDGNHVITVGLGFVWGGTPRPKK